MNKMNNNEQIEVLLADDDPNDVELVLRVFKKHQLANKVYVVKDGVLFFNPGSPTDKVFAAYNSYGILEINDKKVEGKIVKI